MSSITAGFGDGVGSAGSAVAFCLNHAASNNSATIAGSRSSSSLRMVSCETSEG